MKTAGEIIFLNKRINAAIEERRIIDASRWLLRLHRLEHAYVSGTWYDKFTYYSVVGTKLNFSSSYQKNQGGVVESGNYHKIYRVVGYKY